tara:strand:- start:116 stop:424 length:309 start_codon:yes stop_codon:yes gene_type:complete
MNYKYKTYFKTTPMGAELYKKFSDGAIKQEEAVTLIFAASSELISPSDALYLYPDNVPITSIRRAITQLTKKGILVKTDYTKTSEWGKPEHCWVHSKFSHLI